MNPLGLDDIRAIFAASKLQDKLLNEAMIDWNQEGTEFTASIEYQYASGEYEIFEGRGKTPYDAYVVLSKELRQWTYGKSEVSNTETFSQYASTALLGGSN